MNRLFILFAFIFICTTGCKKDYPVSSSETPIFYFKGTVNGTPVNMQAGVNNYYMFSSFKQDSNNIYNFFGELKPTNCNNCNNKIKFQINDYTVSPLNGTTQTNTSLTENYYSIQGLDSSQLGTSTEYVVNFTSIPDLNGQVSTYSWDFGDGTSDLDAHPSHTYSHPGYYNTCLTVTYSDGCTGSACNEVRVGVPNAGCGVTIIDSAHSGNTNSFEAFGTGAPTTYLWDFGDGISSTTNTNTVLHTYTSPGIYKVCLQTTDPGNCSSEVCKNVSTQGFSGCLTNFDFFVQGAIPNSLSLSTIIIKWTDNSGIEYSSNTIYQPGDSYFQIISVAGYSNNEKNQPTKKLQVKLKCNLFDGTNSILINGDGVIAVAYQ